MKKFIPVLAKCPLFGGVAGDDLAAMLDLLGAKPQRYAKGETILAEGDPADRLGVVLSGAVQVFRLDYCGNRSLMGRLEAGDIFAEAFACAGVPAMPVSVTAQETAEVLLIDAGRIMQPCEGGCSFHHLLIYNLMRILALKNLACNQKIEVTSKRTTREKLMAYLLLQAKKAGSSSFVIPFDRQELADYLEVDRSGLSAEIGKLRREGVLRCERNRFTLMNGWKVN